MPVIFEYWLYIASAAFLPTGTTEPGRKIYRI
jgi:hypothetical protein